MKSFLLGLLLVGPVWGMELLPGDILLQPLNCWVCNLIEGQEKSPYSHMGIIIKSTPKEIIVAEALGEVRAVSLEKFKSRTQKGERIMVRRHVNKRLWHRLEFLFYNLFEGTPYDAKFSWKNDALYCSELVYKLMHFMTPNLPAPKPMEFTYQREFWDRYFDGMIPDGEPGNSPADFERSHYYTTIGFL
jgi:hypothetical protein